MSDLFPTSGPLDLYSGTTTAREFYLHSNKSSGPQPVDEPSGQPPEEQAEIDHTISGHEAQRELQLASYFSHKTIVDRLITAGLMVVALPLMVVIGLAILILDGRPVFYRQIRVGKHGRKYWMWKFRTMCRDAESKTGAVWSTDADPRVTGLGRWLRCSHLDELPQFFNVLMGDMNLIGPRPERPEFIRELARDIPAYEQRLKARPGITGLAQLRLGYDRSIADVKHKLTLDLEYIQTASFAADFKIIVGTIPYIVSRLMEKWASARATSQQPDVEVGEEIGELTPPLRRPDPPAPTERAPHLFPTTPVVNANVLPQSTENL